MAATKLVAIQLLHVTIIVTVKVIIEIHVLTQGLVTHSPKPGAHDKSVWQKKAATYKKNVNMYMGHSPSMRSRWLNIGKVIFGVFMDRDGV